MTTFLKTMNLFFIYVALIGYAADLIKSYTLDEIRCEVCKSVATEVAEIIDAERSKAIVNVGCHRLDAEGNLMSSVIPLVQSESFLTEAMETACERMENYTRGYDKKTQKLRVVRLVTGDKVNNELADINAISDADLNESLKFHCEGITDEYEDEFFRVFRSKVDDRVEELCSKLTGLCQKEERTHSEL